MNAALGDVSAGGLGSPLSEVSQRGGGPNAFVANHPGGTAGGVTLSKFSADVTSGKHDGHLPRLCASRGQSAAPAAMSNTTQRTFPNRVNVNEHFSVSIIAAGVQPTLLPNRADARQSLSSRAQLRHLEMKCVIPCARR
jgi:hypothetical protein